MDICEICSEAGLGNIQGFWFCEKHFGIAMQNCKSALLDFIEAERRIEKHERAWKAQKEKEGETVNETPNG